MAVTTVSPVTTKTIEIFDKTRVYTLYYHYRASAPKTLVFEFKGSFNEAIERGRAFCARVNYRFIKVKPFIIDLDEREKRITTDLGYDDD